MTGEDHPMFGKNHSDLSKEKMSKSRKGKTYSELFPPEIEVKLRKQITMRFTGKNNPRYSKINKRTLLKCINQGLDNKEIADFFNCSLPTIIARIKKYFNKTASQIRLELFGAEQGPSKFINADVVLKYLKQGKSRKEIAKILNVTPSTVLRIVENKFHKKVVDLQHEISYSKVNKERFLTLVKSGKTKKEISKVLNIPLTSLFRYISFEFSTNFRELQKQYRR